MKHAKRLKLSLFPLATLALIGAFAMLTLVQSGARAEAAGESHVISVLGQKVIDGQLAFVDIVVLVPAGQDADAVGRAALARQGAGPIDSAAFKKNGTWKQFGNNNANDDFVLQRYNGSAVPPGVDGETALRNTQATWSAVPTSSFQFEYDEEQAGLACPSLLDKCDGPQFFDGHNDVAWHPLDDENTLAVTWFSFRGRTQEADFTMNTEFNWTTTSGGSGYDVETVMLHENGHVVGLGHSNEDGAIMQPFYGSEQRWLGADDILGVETLYPGESAPLPTVSIATPTNGQNFETGLTVAYSATATGADGTDLSATITWTLDGDNLTTGAGGMTSALDAGDYTFVASVTEDGTTVTVTDTVTITVGTVVDITPGSLAASISLSPEGPYVHRDIVTIVVRVTDGAASSSPVSGVAVHLTVVTESGRTLAGDATTNASGDATLTYKVNSKRDGVGPYTVNAVATLGTTLSATATAEFLVE